MRPPKTSPARSARGAAFAALGAILAFAAPACSAIIDSGAYTGGEPPTSCVFNDDCAALPGRDFCWQGTCVECVSTQHCPQDSYCNQETNTCEETGCVGCGFTEACTAEAECFECDRDGDSYFNDDDPACASFAPGEPPDCDDDDPDIHPGRWVVCGDGIRTGCPAPAVNGIEFAEVGYLRNREIFAGAGTDDRVDLGVAHAPTEAVPNRLAVGLRRQNTPMRLLLGIPDAEGDLTTLAQDDLESLLGGDPLPLASTRAMHTDVDGGAILYALVGPPRGAVVPDPVVGALLEGANTELVGFEGSLSAILFDESITNVEYIHGIYAAGIGHMAPTGSNTLLAFNRDDDSATNTEVLALPEGVEIDEDGGIASSGPLVIGRTTDGGVLVWLPGSRVGSSDDTYLIDLGSGDPLVGPVKAAALDEATHIFALPRESGLYLMELSCDSSAETPLTDRCGVSSPLGPVARAPDQGLYDIAAQGTAVAVATADRGVSGAAPPVVLLRGILWGASIDGEPEPIINPVAAGIAAAEIGDVSLSAVMSPSNNIEIAVAASVRSGTQPWSVLLTMARYCSSL